MAKAFFFVIPVLLLFIYDVCKGLECYHCFENAASIRSSEFVECNKGNMTASNTWVCPEPNARCVYQVLKIQSTEMQQTWRTCSKGHGDPCDPNKAPPGFKLLKCSHCGTDRCNLGEAAPEKEKNVFTFNVNANVNLFIRQ